jgi:hypothetical protein
MMNELKPSCGLIRGIGDGNSGGWEGSKLSMNSFRSSCFSVCDRKNLIAETKMQCDFH